MNRRDPRPPMVVRRFSGFDPPAGPPGGGPHDDDVQVLEGAVLRPGHHLVDLSAGGALLSPAVLETVGPAGSVTTVAATAAVLAALRPTAENGWTWGSVWDKAVLPLDGGSVDAAVGRAVLAHVRHPRPFLAELVRVLKPGGRLSLCEPLLAQRERVTLDGMDADEVTAAEDAVAAVQPAAHTFSIPRAVSTLALAGFTAVEHTTGQVTTTVAGLTAVEARLGRPGPAGESALDAVSRALGADYARRYLEAWLTTVRQSPVTWTTPVVYLTGMRAADATSPVRR